MTVATEQAAGLILVGHQRSGTTLPRVVHNTHPFASITIKFGCYMNVDQSFGPYAKDIVQRSLRKRNNPFFNYYGGGKDHLIGEAFIHNGLLCTRFLWKIKRQQSGIVDQDLIAAGLHHLFPKAAIVGDKPPDYWYRLEQLIRQPTLLVGIYRDPRDMASSVLLKARGKWSRYWPEELKMAKNVAVRWMAVMDKLERYRDKIHLVCYEELATEPARVMKGLGSYLGLDPAGFNLSRIHPRSIGKYRKTLSKQEVSDVTEIVADRMMRYGYVP